jgi:hypothetical protein
VSDTAPAADGDATPAELAQAVDAALDACDAALDAGDIPAAKALLTAAEETSDSLLEALGVPDVVDVNEGP